METNNLKEISSDYRSSRKAVSIFCGIGIAWAAAQFEIKQLSLGPLGNVDIENSSIPIIIAVLCIYSMYRSTLEFMMQPKTVRRWPLAKIDYQVTLYLFRFTLVALTVSAIARSWGMVLYIAGAFLLGFIFFFCLSLAFMFIIMSLRLAIRKLSGRKSVASAAVEAMYYSLALSAIVYIISICLIAFYGFNPFIYLGGNFREISSTQILIFSGVSLIVVISFILDERFLALVFASEPLMIEKEYVENGVRVFSVEPNPNHPDYDKHKDTPAIKFEKIRVK